MDTLWVLSPRRLQCTSDILRDKIGPYVWGPWFRGFIAGDICKDRDNVVFIVYIVAMYFIATFCGE